MKPIDAYTNTIARARRLLSYHDALINTRSRRIRRDWRESFLRLMHWPIGTPIERVDSKDAVIILKAGSSLTPQSFSQAHLEDHLRSALALGISALDRYVHERVVKGIVPALKTAKLTRQQEELSIPVTTAIKISAEALLAQKRGLHLRPTNIVRKKVQELLHKRPFQSYREIEYAFNLLGVQNLSTQLQTAFGINNLKPVTTQLGHIAMRRNQIVHEWDLVRHARGGKAKLHPISRRYVHDSLDFLDRFVSHLETVT
jgi:hypothetical protein